MRFQCPFCQYINHAVTGQEGTLFSCHSCKKPLNVPDGLQDGSVVGDYVIKAKIGSGSIGTVYKAVQFSLGRTVALKVLSPAYTNRKGLEDFLTEARAAAKLNHPNLVQSLAVGENDGYCYMAMTLLAGMTVKSRIKQQKHVPVDEALHIVQQVAEALHYAWMEAKLIHRDVKPENIILTDDGLVKLTDLGLAMRQKDWKEGMEISGSPSYMSPEQFYGEKLDSRSDIYSLGVTLYQMLSGVLPFKSQTVKSLALQHIQEEAVPLSKLNLRIPPMVSALVKKMMAKRVDERFQSMEELLGQIWKIRQKTAPDKDLVPSVHTISIRRLDYDRQLTPHKDFSPTNNGQSLYPFGPGGPAVPIKIRGNPVIGVLLLIIFLLLVGFCFYLFVRNMELERSSTISYEERALRRRIEIFCEMAEKSEASPEHLKQQSAELVREIRSIAAPQELELIVSLSLQNYNYQRDYRRAIEYENMYNVMKTSLEEKTEALSKMQKDVVDGLKNIDNNELVKKLTIAAEKYALENKQLKADYAVFKLETDSMRHRAEKSVRESMMHCVYNALRSRNPGEAIDYMNVASDKMRVFTDSEYRFFYEMASVAARIDNVLRRGTGITGRTTQINGTPMTLTGVISGNLTFLDDQKRIIPYQISRLPPKEVYMILKPAFKDVDSEFVMFTTSIVRGEVGDAIAYCGHSLYRKAFVQFIIVDMMKRLRAAMRDNPVRAAEYERSIVRAFGTSPEFKSLLAEAEKLIAGAKAFVPEAPGTLTRMTAPDSDKLPTSSDSSFSK